MLEEIKVQFVQQLNQHIQLQTSTLREQLQASQNQLIKQEQANQLLEKKFSTVDTDLFACTNQLKLIQMSNDKQKYKPNEPFSKFSHETPKPKPKPKPRYSESNYNSNNNNNNKGHQNPFKNNKFTYHEQDKDNPAPKPTPKPVNYTGLTKEKLTENINVGVGLVFQYLNTSIKGSIAINKFYRSIMLIIAPDRCDYRNHKMNVNNNNVSLVDPILFDSIDKLIRSSLNPVDIDKIKWQTTLEQLKLLFSSKIDNKICNILSTSVNKYAKK
jgi:hypothetical protein